MEGRVFGQLGGVNLQRRKDEVNCVWKGKIMDYFEDQLGGIIFRKYSSRDL